MSDPLKFINDLKASFKDAFGVDAGKFTRVGGTLIAYLDEEVSEQDEDALLAVLSVGSLIVRKLCQDPPPRQRAEVFTASLIVHKHNDNCYTLIGDKKEVERNTPLI